MMSSSDSMRPSTGRSAANLAPHMDQVGGRGGVGGWHSCHRRGRCPPSGADSASAVAAAPVASHERRAYVLGPLRSRRAGCGPRLGRPAPNSRSPWRQLQSRRTNGTCTCSAHCDRDAQGEAHTWAARRQPADRREGSGGCVARAARVRARLAAIATRRERPTLGPHGAEPPTAVAAVVVASLERHMYVLGSLQSRTRRGQPTLGPTSAYQPPAVTVGACTCSARSASL